MWGGGAGGGEAAETLDNPSGAPEGVAFYNPRTAAIEGWATGCASVWVQFPGQGGQTARKLRPGAKAKVSPPASSQRSTTRFRPLAFAA